MAGVGIPKKNIVCAFKFTKKLPVKILITSIMSDMYFYALKIDRTFTKEYISLWSIFFHIFLFKRECVNF